MLGRLSFRVRILLLVLVVALPPLFAFGLFAVTTTGSVGASFERSAAERGAERTVELLARALADAERRIAPVARDSTLARAVRAEDVETARREYATHGVDDWSAAVVTDGEAVLLTAATADARRQLERLALDVERPARGLLLAHGRLLLVTGAPLAPSDDEAPGQLVIWRDETDGLWAEMRIASGGSLALATSDGSLAAGADGEAALQAATGATADGRTAAITSLTMADGTPSELVVLADPTGLDFAAVGLGPALVAVAGVAALWAVLLAMAFARSVGRQMTALAIAAERVGRGDFAAAASPRVAARDELARLAVAHGELARSLEERNRQIAEVAEQVAALRIGDDPTDVARGVSRAAARVTGQPGWTVAVLHTAAPELLPAGRYGNDAVDGRRSLHPSTPLDRAAWEELGGRSATRGARYITVEGGTAVAALVSAGDEVHGVLVAPWDGRTEPTAADLDVYGLLGQHAGTAIGQAILYARLRAQATELERLAALQGDFLRGVTHDLQTPLTSIAALSTELSALRGLDEPAQADLRAIRDQADRLRRMVSQLLTVSRLGAGAIQPRQEVVRAAPLVVRTWQALHARGRRLALEPDPNDHLLIADPDRLEQVLWAVLDNAVKYSPAGSDVTVRLRSHRTLPDERELQPHATSSELVGVIEVTDRGDGMEPEVVAHAFDQFYRSDEARAAVPDGSGIGLYAARGLVLAMGGTVRIRSAPGTGTTVRICLPAEAAAEEPAQVADATVGATAPVAEPR